MDDSFSVPQRVTVLGAGVIGGSLALALHGAGAAVTVYDPDASAHESMRSRGLDVAASPREAVLEAEWVVVATCDDLVVPTAEKVLPAMSPGAILSDVASVKTVVVAGLDALCAGQDVRLVSTHPLAGSAQSGFAHASPEILTGATWVLLPGSERHADAAQRVRAALERIGAGRVVELSAATHDAVLAATSHLPQVVCSVLAATVGSLVSAEQLSLSGGGLRDTTRIADSSLTMWLPILTTNADNVAGALDEMIAGLQEVQQALRADPRVLAQLFERAHRMREQLPRS